MTSPRFRLIQLSALGLILGQALGLVSNSSSVFAQSPTGIKPALPTPMSAQSLVGLDAPPQMVVAPKQAIPISEVP